MDWGSILYLGVTFGLFVVFAVIVFRTYRKKNRSKLEEPKHRMLDDE
jgi:Cbb3-type cytochrome oxidase component FixQ